MYKEGNSETSICLKFKRIEEMQTTLEKLAKKLRTGKEKE